MYSLEIEDKLLGLINRILGGLSILSLVELIVGGIKLFLCKKGWTSLKIDPSSSANNI